VVLEPALHARNELAFVHETTTHFLDSHRAVVDAIVAGDATRAHSAMTILMDQSARDSEAIVSKDPVGAALMNKRPRGL